MQLFQELISGFANPSKNLESIPCMSHTGCSVSACALVKKKHVVDNVVAQRICPTPSRGLHTLSSSKAGNEVGQQLGPFSFMAIFSAVLDAQNSQPGDALEPRS